MKNLILPLSLVSLAGSVLAGCPSTPAGDDAGPLTDAAISTDDAPATPDAFVEACSPTDPICQDQSISQLDFFDTVSTAAITEEGETEGEFLTLIDATGGGMTPTQSYVYARFTDTGLERVEISDEDSLVSSEWDIAFRRFIIRLNSGVGGPSCVAAGRTAPGTTFESLTEAPESLTYRTEQYFTEPTCDLVPDGSGLGSPATALSSFWTYPGCVQMTGNVYVVRPASGRHVKLEVVSYYPPANQEICQTSSSVPIPSGGGALRVRWAFLD
jgi:hypothetical protein